MSANFDWSQFEPVEKTQEKIDWSQFEPVESAYKDVVGEEISQKAQQFEDENEFERMYEKGAAEATRGLLSGATLGLSENIPSFKPEEGIGTEIMKFTGSLLPIHQISKVFSPLATFAAKSPIMSKGLSGLANIVGAGLTGATVNTLEQAFKGEIPDSEEVLKHGASWSALDAVLRATGKIGAFSSSLIKRATGSGKPKYSVLNNVIKEMEKSGVDFSTPEKAANKALEVLEKIPEKSISSSDILNKKITPESFKTNIQPIAEKAEAYNLGEIDTEALSKDIEKLPSYVEIEKISPRAESELQLGKNIQKDIETQFENNKNTYEPLYQEVEEESKNILHKPEETIKLVNKAKEKINSLKTRPEGYQKVITTLDDILSDIGVTELKVSDQFKGKFPPIIQEIRLPKLIELGRRLNKIIDYDIIGSSIKDELKPIVKSVKQEIRSALSKKNPNLSEKFSKAELNYGKTAEKFGNEDIIKIRSEESPEKLISNIDSPSRLGKIKNIVTSQQFNQIEREILENAKNLNHSKVAELARQLRGIVSDNSYNALKALEKDKLPLGKLSREKRLRQGIADDIADSVSTGQRPEKTLKLWKTQKGQNLINQALKETPNKKEILDYLKTQSFYDFASSVVDNKGKINFKKMQDFLADPSFRNNLESIGGKQAVTFFKNLESLSNKMDKNLNLSSKISKVIKSERGETLLKRIREHELPEAVAIENAINSLGIPGKTMLSFFGYMNFGLPKASIMYLGGKVLYKLAKNVKFRNSFIEALNKSYEFPIESVAILDKMASEANEK